MEVSVEYVRWLQEERAKINRAALESITWYEGGVIVPVRQAIVEEWGFVGLSNIDFITCGRYLDKEL